MRRILILILLGILGFAGLVVLWVSFIFVQVVLEERENAKYPIYTYYVPQGIVTSSDKCNTTRRATYCRVTFVEGRYGYYNIDDYAKFEAGDVIGLIILTQGDGQTTMGCNFSDQQCKVASICSEKTNINDCWSYDYAKGNFQVRLQP